LHSDTRLHIVERVFDATQLTDRLEALATEDRSTWSSRARAARLVELRAVQERLDAQVLCAVTDRDAADTWHDDCRGPISWLAAKTDWCAMQRRAS
jgi:hypothetical protein